MQHGTGRILTSHVGSLIRPPDLVAMLRALQNGEPVDNGAYEARLKRAVADIVRQQAAVGIDIVSDGEFGKSISWSRYVLQRLSGFEQRNVKPGDNSFPAAVVGKDRRDFPEFYAEYDPAQGSPR